MGKASSSKKVARAARAGGSRRVGQRRNLGFPTLIIAIIVAGVLLVVFAREERDATAAPRFGATAPPGDHWHAAYNVVVCGTVQPGLNDAKPDTSGIHSHGDGVIHIHPFTRGFAGPNARMDAWFDIAGLEVGDDRVVLPDGTAFEDGKDDCDGEEAMWRVAVWDSAADALAGEDPSRIVDDDFGSLRFRSDREAYTLAFGPEGETIPAPDSVPTLDNLSDVAPPEDDSTTTSEGDEEDVDSSSTTTGEPEGSTTTTPPDGATTTAPAGTPPDGAPGTDGTGSATTTP